MAGRIWMQHAANDNCGMGSRAMCDDRIIMESGCTIPITLRTGVLSVIITLSPLQCTVHPEYSQPQELTYIFV